MLRTRLLHGAQARSLPHVRAAHLGLSEDVQVSVDETVRGIDLTLSATSLLEPWDDIQVRVSVGSDVTFGIYQIPIYFTPVSSPDRQQIYLTLTITDQVYQTYIPLAQR